MQQGSAGLLLKGGGGEAAVVTSLADGALRPAVPLARVTAGAYADLPATARALKESPCFRELRHPTPRRVVIFLTASARSAIRPHGASLLVCDRQEGSGVSPGPSPFLVLVGYLRFALMGNNPIGGGPGEGIWASDADFTGYTRDQVITDT